MTDKEKIVEVLKAYTKKNNISASVVILEEYAEELVRQGVIVPPCKVGDILWIPSVNSDKVYSKVIKEILIHEKDGEIGKYVYASSAYFPFENIGKTVFLTKEEAEKALAERSKE